ncbi:MAG TPA: metalloregulator ArsR/SmtB family transcription factor [Rhodocyclaceae bacterium]|nr:metalloregulator ArsR/SmtB family transcription factor [Rhodocyclaceae bacterium]
MRQSSASASISATSAHLDDTLIALADPTRRAILQRLAQGSARVTEVAAPFAISLNSVSKHIRLLERADLVRREQRGRDHWLSLNPQPVDQTLQWLQAQRDAWSARLDTLEALLRAEDAATAGQSARPVAQPARPAGFPSKPAARAGSIAAPPTPKAKGKRK